jgi:hypothetical protein
MSPGAVKETNDEKKINECGPGVLRKKNTRTHAPTGHALLFHNQYDASALGSTPSFTTPRPSSCRPAA